MLYSHPNDPEWIEPEFGEPTSTAWRAAQEAYVKAGGDLNNVKPSRSRR
jgi:hypothetical protein